MYNNHALKHGRGFIMEKIMLEVLTLEEFKLYHKLLKQYIDGNDSQSVDLVEMTEDVLNISKLPNDINEEDIEQEN